MTSNNAKSPNSSKNAGNGMRAGSCALIVLFVQDFCYVANVGDSEAILSSNFGQNIF